MLSHTLWQRQIVVATKLAVRHGGRIWWSRVLKSRGLRAAVRSLDFYVYKERAPGAEGGREQLCSLSRANQRPRICELKYPGSLFCHGGTGPGAGNAGDGPGCLFRHTQSFIWATKCPFRATFTPQGSSLGRISCPETAHHMKASRKKASTKSPRVRSPPQGPEPSHTLLQFRPATAAVISSGSHLHMHLAISVHQAASMWIMRLFL